MKNLQEIIEKKTTGTGWTIDQVANIIGRSRGGYYSGFERKKISIWEFDLLSKEFDIEPNWLFEWKGKSSKSEPIAQENKTEKETILESEVKFLRDQVKTMNEIIKELTKNKN